MTSSYPQQRARLRELLGRSPQTGASSLAPSAPPVVLGLTTGGASTCAGCEDGCVLCVPVATGVCDGCGEPYEGDVTSYERGGVTFLRLHTLTCDPVWPRVQPLPDGVAKALAAAGFNLTFDGRWRL